MEHRGSTRSYLALDREALTRGPGVAPLVAVHFAPPSVARDEELRSQFAARASALLPLRHPNLVRVHEFVAESRWCYWVSEAVQGLPLSRLLRAVENGKRVLTTQQFIRIGCDVLRGLEHAHAATDGAGEPRPAVHRHLCPGTVLVGYDGTVKINHVVSCGSPELTTGPVAGLAERLPYLAPECCAGELVDARADLYAVGAIVWEAVANRPRSFGATLQEAIEMRLQGSEPSLAEVSPGAPARVVALTQRALAADPAKRHQDAQQLRHDLEALLLSGAVAGRAEGSFQAEGESLVELMRNHFSVDYAGWVEIHRRRVISISALPKRVEDAPRASAAATSRPRAEKTSEPSLPATGRSVMRLRQRPGVWILASAVLGALAVFGLMSGPETTPEGPGVSPSVSPGVSTVVRPLEPPPIEAASASPVANRAAAEMDGTPTEDPARLPSKSIARDEAPRELTPDDAEPASSDARPMREPDAPTRRAQERKAPEADARNGVARSAIPLVEDDAETLSALGKDVDEAGLDLRSRTLRPPRAIDKENPYSP